jgi:hypothetical protein
MFLVFDWRHHHPRPTKKIMDVLSSNNKSLQQTSYSPLASEMKRSIGRRGLTTFPIIFLLVFIVTDVDSFSAQVPSPGVVLTNPSRDISKSILEGLRSSPPTLTAKLDLETDLYDASTGLCSEGKECKRLSLGKLAF